MNSEIVKMRDMARASGEPVLRNKSYEILLKIIREKKPKRILEVGTNVGLSGISMLLESENSLLTGIEIDEDIIAIAKENYKKFGVENRAKIFEGDAGEIIKVLTGKYDFIFLDGPKGHYYEYLPYLLDALNVGGVLFADNVLFMGLVNSKEKTPKKHNTIKYSMEKFLKEITTNPNLKSEVLDIEDGISITEKIK